ncbi:MAG: hypothetical protein ACXVPU_09600 [Bacteroidia bacterium]
MFSCKARYAYNPYLHAKNKPSDIQRKGEQKQIKIGTKAYAEQMKKNKKDIQGNIQKATDPQKKYKKITKRKRNKKSKDHTWHL